MRVYKDHTPLDGSTMVKWLDAFTMVKWLDAFTMQLMA